MALPEHHHAFFYLRAHHRDIAGVISWRFLLLVSCLVFLIDNDEAEILKWREHCAARADHNLRAAGMDLVPFIVPLAFGQVAVQNGDCVLRFGETALEAFDRLRRERNLGDENDCCASAVDRGADRLQVNFRFARAGDAVEQNRARVIGRVERLDDFLQRACLFFVQDEVRRCDELLVGVRIAHDSLFAQLSETALYQRTQRLVIERRLPK